MNTLTTGSKGADVTTLQQNLADLGYTINVDGDFGNGTKATVVQFQTDHQLSADGVVGPNTWAAITNALSAAKVKGMDISHNNGTINWGTLSPDIRFAYCKASQGSGFKDNMLSNYITHLKQKQMIYGAYHFLTFQSTAQAQVDNYLGCGVDFSVPGVLPPALDIEDQVGKTDAETKALNQFILHNRGACIQIMHDWLEEVSIRTGRVPVIYTYRSFWKDYLGNPAGFEKYPLWIASYQAMPPGLPPGWNKYTIWQNFGAQDGVAGSTDLNLFNGNMNDLRQFATPGVKAINT